jgi:hypothetical protein
MGVKLGLLQYERNIGRGWVANRVLRKIFGTMKTEVTGEWRRLHKEELHDLYSSPNIVRVNK